jgi:hypothetical protein
VRGDFEALLDTADKPEDLWRAQGGKKALVLFENKFMDIVKAGRLENE